MDDCAGVGEGKEGRKRREMRRLYVKRAGQREGGGSLSPGSTVVVENQLKTEARRVLPSDAFVSVSIALATHSDGALCGRGRTEMWSSSVHSKDMLIHMTNLGNLHFLWKIR